jgi:hypothetical protein
VVSTQSTTRYFWSFFFFFFFFTNRNGHTFAMSQQKCKENKTYIQMIEVATHKSWQLLLQYRQRRLMRWRCVMNLSVAVITLRVAWVFLLNESACNSKVHLHAVVVLTSAGFYDDVDVDAFRLLNDLRWEASRTVAGRYAEGSVSRLPFAFR